MTLTAHHPSTLIVLCCYEHVTQLGCQFMPEIGARERVTTWKILIIKKESGILRVVIADPLISANKHMRARTHTYSGVSKLHPDFWLLMVSHTGKTSVQQAFPLWHQDRTISNWKVSLFVCLSDLGEGVYKNLPWSDRQFGSRGTFLVTYCTEVVHKDSAGTSWTLAWTQNSKNSRIMLGKSRPLLI